MINITVLKERIPVCLNCGRRCPLDSVSCTKGQDFVLGMLYTMSVMNSGADSSNADEETNCPLCPRHCDFSEVSCEKGFAYEVMVFSGES
jgi:hypothetical protein